ncbi:MAG: choice-of-anchor Q domain-containing protein [Caldilineaceae bacterium]
MFRKMVGLPILVVGLLLQTASAAFALPTRADDTVITNCSDDIQLRNAIAEGGTISFNCGVATVLLNGRIEVAKEVVIDGGGKITISGGNTSAFFQVFSNQKLTLRGLTLSDGKFAGGYPLEIFGEATLDGVTMRNNQTDSSGGAVAVFNRLIVQNSTFQSNSATSTPSTAAKGAAILIDGGTAEVYNSVFSENTITGGSSTGGAISVNSGSLVVSESEFHSNSALDGAAIYLAENTQVTVTHTLFDNNSGGYGGAIESWGTLNLEYSTLSNNEATIGDGGGLWMVKGVADISHSTFSHNQAMTTGGGISCYADTISITHSTLNSNTATTNGAAIYSTCTLQLVNSTLSGNTATSGGGGVYQQQSGTATLGYVTIANNSAAFGAGVYNDGSGSSTLTIEKSLLANNTTGDCDGVVTSLGYNLSSDTHCADFTKTGDQKNVALPLGPLTTNGGFTATHLPSNGNPAIDHVPANECNSPTDQRDLARPQNSPCDSGAVEVEGVGNLFLPLLSR